MLHILYVYINAILRINMRPVCCNIITQILKKYTRDIYIYMFVKLFIYICILLLCMLSIYVYFIYTHIYIA